MLKKIIVTTLVVIVMVSTLVIPANALTMTEDDRPVGIIGIDLLRKYYEKYGNSEEEVPVPDYQISMAYAMAYGLPFFRARQTSRTTWRLASMTIILLKKKSIFSGLTD